MVTTLIMRQRRAFQKQRAGCVLVFLEGLKALWFALAQSALPAFRGVTFAMAIPSLIYGLATVTLGSTMIRWPQWLVRLA